MSMVASGLGLALVPFVTGLRAGDPGPPWTAVFVLAWSGLRGVVSLASALAPPLVIDDGAASPFRDDIVFIMFGVIVVTLLG